jgi:hypothetical protein
MKTFILISVGLIPQLSVFAQGPLSARGFTPAGAFQLEVRGGPLQVEYTTNLSSWLPLAGGRGTITDPASTNSEFRVYRARSGQSFVSNVVGYARVVIPPGKVVAVASPFMAPLRLNQPAGMIAVFGTATPIAAIDLQREGKLATHSFDDLENTWIPPLPEIPWGTGFFVRGGPQAPLTVTFMGELPHGELTRAIPTEESLMGPLVPKPGPVQDALGAVPMDGAEIKVWNEEAQKYETSRFDGSSGRWVPTLSYRPGRALNVKWPEVAFKKRFTPTQ